MMSHSDERDIELIRRLKKATSVQEILEITSLLKWDFSEEEARELLALITPDEPKKKWRSCSTRYRLPVDGKDVAVWARKKNCHPSASEN